MVVVVDDDGVGGVVVVLVGVVVLALALAVLALVLTLFWSSRMRAAISTKLMDSWNRWKVGDISCMDFP